MTNSSHAIMFQFGSILEIEKIRALWSPADGRETSENGLLLALCQIELAIHRL
jgi:hypothetical protein